MMRGLLNRVVLIAWSLLFGGNVAAFFFFSVLFKEQPHIAGTAGGVIFPAFERFAIPTMAVLLIGLVAIRLMTGKASATAAFVLTGLAAVLLVISATRFTPKVNDLRVAGKTKTPEFRKLHGMAMGVSFAHGLSLLGAGLFLPAVMRDKVEVEKPE